MSSSEIDMSCKLFGLLLGFVALLMVLVGLPAFLVTLQASTQVCLCADNTDIYSASITSDTVVRAQLVAGGGGRARGQTFGGLVTDCFKGRVPRNATLRVALPDSDDPCGLGPAEAGQTYLLAGSLLEDGVLEVSRCGNLTRWDHLDNATLRFLAGMFNWYTGECAAGPAPYRCREDPCRAAASACNVSGAVCVPNPCLPCEPPAAQAIFWLGRHRVCIA